MELHLSQSSQQIKLMEELGCPLFMRLGKCVPLKEADNLSGTPMGSFVISKMLRWQSAKSTLRGTIRRGGGSTTGHLPRPNRISPPDALATILGSCCGTPVTCYIGSSSDVSEGGRAGCATARSAICSRRSRERCNSRLRSCSINRQVSQICQIARQTTTARNSDRLRRAESALRIPRRTRAVYVSFVRVNSGFCQDLVRTTGKRDR